MQILKREVVSEERWRRLTFFQQMGNTGSEISRALNWWNKDRKKVMRFVDAAIILLDLTIADPKNLKRGKELWRVREAIADYFYGNNEYHSTPDSWRNYFDAFAYAANLANPL